MIWFCVVFVIESKTCLSCSFSFCRLAAAASARVTDSWYSEEKDYDYATGGKTAECEAIGSSCMIGHFTQVVWNGSTKLGCGFAHGTSQGMQCTWAVCRYTPPGNYVGQYVENVETPTA